MEAYLVEWLNILGRWVHFITGIAWIGSSFYFIWLDNHLENPKPASLPETLHWFKWEAYTTWISGMFLLMLVYWYGADVYLVDRTVADLSPMKAVSIAVAFLAGGWIIYDILCRSPLGRHDGALAFVLFLLTAVLAWALTQLYSGRGAYIHFGAVLGTIMVANVFFVIIPGQRRMVDAYGRGEEPNADDGIRAKQRSVHNTYFTLPVLFVMTSNHYAVTYSHDYSWLILVAFTLAGALIRIYFVARHKDRASPLYLVVAGLILLAAGAGMAPKSRVGLATNVTFDMVRPVILERCTNCHSASPTHIAFPAAPAGVLLDTDEQILGEAERIHQQTVVLKAMPIANLTEMSDKERALIEAWYLSINE
jgi:uncharacterized membrane protein